jgi:hypothetical protein
MRSPLNWNILPLTDRDISDIRGNNDWMTYKTIQLDKDLTHQFPADFQAYWIRFTSHKDTTATAQLKFE